MNSTANPRQQLPHPGLSLQQQALRRAVGGAMLLADFPDGLSLQDFRALLPDDYGGIPESVQRRLRRDHLHLLGADVRVSFQDGAYHLDSKTHVAPLCLTRGEAALLEAAGRLLLGDPAQAILAHRVLLRLGAAGAPVLPLLLQAPTLEPLQPNLGGHTRVALGLLGALTASDEREVGIGDLVRITRCSSVAELLEVVRALQAISVPLLGPPRDEVAVDVAGDRIQSYFADPPLRPTRLRMDEVLPLLRAVERLAGSSARPFLVVKILSRAVASDSPADVHLDAGRAA